jgi:uncharacterized membrane protein
MIALLQPLNPTSRGVGIVMEETLYRIVFDGKTIPGLTAQQIIDAFSKRFQVREEKARAIVLSNGRTVLKRNLDQHRAQRYSSVLHEVGLLVVIEPEHPERLTTPRSVSLNPSINITQSEFASSVYDTAPPSQTSVPPVAPQDAVAPAAAPTPRHAEKTNGNSKHRDSGPARADNPYAPPAADLSVPETRGFSGEALRPPRAVPAGHGLTWINAGWRLFKERPWPWIGAFLVYALFTIALSLIPYGVGSLLTTILGPMLTGGLMIGAHRQHHGGGFSVNALLAGMKYRPGPLALVGVAYFGFVFLIALAAILGVGAALILTNPDLIAGLKTDAFDPDQAGSLMLLPVLFAALIGIPLAMAVYFAPALVALNEIPVLRAFKLSFQGCWRNILPFLVFGLIALLLFVASLFTLGLALLILIPILIIATYMAYRDIYYW